MHTKISDLQRQLVEICYSLIFVYNSTDPQNKILYEWSKIDPKNDQEWYLQLQEIKKLCDHSINQIIINDIPKNYFDLWMKNKIDYLTWARDL